MKLKEHLKQTGETPYAFFKKHCLPRDPVYRAAKGKKVSYGIAKLISEATVGKVTIEDLME